MKNHRWRCSEWINLIQWVVKKKLKFSISLFGFFEKSSSNPVMYMTSVNCARNSHNSVDCSSSLYDFACPVFSVRHQIYWWRYHTARLSTSLLPRRANTSHHPQPYEVGKIPGSLPFVNPKLSHTHTAKNSHSPSTDRLCNISITSPSHLHSLPYISSLSAIFHIRPTSKWYIFRHLPLPRTQ